MATERDNQVQHSELLISIRQMLDEKITPITDRLCKIEKSLSFAMDEILKIKTLEKAHEQQIIKNQQVQAQVIGLKAENKNLKEQLLSQEVYSRKNNIRIIGISCNENQNLEDEIIQTVGKVGISLSARDIERVHYTTPARPRVRRPVLLRLLSSKDKIKIMTKKNELQAIQVYVHEDYPKEILERRRMLLPIFFKALELYPELHPKFHIDRFNMGGIVYTVDNIGNIQYPELLPERVFTPAKAGLQAFFTKYSPLSNHHPTRFKVEGQLFSSSEQYYVYQKALHFEDRDLAELILKTSEPERVKQLGKRVQGFNKKEWYRVSVEYMFQAMLAKFTQNEDLEGFYWQQMETDC